MRDEKALAIVTAPPLAAVKTEGSATALAPGFRFHPTDEELVSYYLKRKLLNKPVRFDCIAEVDIYKHEPWELSDKSKLKSRDQEWYFFCLLDKKYGNGGRMNRATKQGYWKATGKDREVGHNKRLIGMKKTLVFHNGRAPDGLRTNWVMHEYRLVEEELERIGALQGYVLCRVFHKKNIGPPNGNRYAPFIEAEWDDDSAVLIPGIDFEDDVVAGTNLIDEKVAATKNAVIESNDVRIIGFEREIQDADKDAPADDIVARKSLNERTDDCPSLSPCKIERPNESPPLCLVNREAPLPLIHYKRRRPTDSGPNHANVSDTSTRTTQDNCSSTTTAVTITMSPSNDTTTAVSALLEFSLMGSVEPRQRKPHVPPPPPMPKTANLDSMLPPGCMKLINELQNEVRKISGERESLKLEMMSAQAMITILQSKIESLSKENEDLKRGNREYWE